MDKSVIMGGKDFHVKYENGVVYFKPIRAIAWVSCQSEPISGLDEEEVMKIARQCAKGLGHI